MAEPTDMAERPGGGPRWLGPAIALALAVPVLVTVVALLGGRWYASGDHGLIWLRAWDVGGAETPLVGPYSRAGWNHPGPLLFYVLAVPLRLFGGDPRGLLVGAAGINLVSVSLIGFWLARRGDLLAAVVVAAAVAVLVATMGGSLLADPWNPYVALLPFAAVLIGAWAVSAGSAWALVAVVPAASLAVQSHAGYALPVLAAVAVGVAGWVWQARGEGLAASLRSSALPLGVAGVLGMAAWAAPLWDQVARSGNLGVLARGGAHSDAGSAERLGVIDALGVTALELWPFGPWATGTEEVQMFTGNVDPAPAWTLVVPLAAMAAAVAVFVARGCGPRLWLAAVAVVTASAGWISTAMVTGTVHPYLIRWWWPVAALWWAVVALAAVELVRPWLRRPLGAVGLAALAVAGLAVLAAATVRAPAAEVPAAHYQAGEAALTGPALAAVERDVPVATRRIGAAWGGEAEGLAVSLEREGIPVAAPEDLGWKYGYQRARRSPAQELIVAAAGAARDADETAAALGGRVVARWDPLSDEQRAEAEALWEGLALAFEAEGETERANSARHYSTWTLFLAPPAVESADMERLYELADEGLPLALIHVPPEAAAEP